MEITILDEIQKLRSPLLDISMPTVSNLIILCFLISIGLFINKSTRQVGFTCMLALLIGSLLCSGLLKPLFSRIRPFDVQTSIHLLILKPTDYSFPSGHTTLSFAFAFALYFSKTNKGWLVALVLAICIAFSRLYLYVHYPSDVLAGIFVGILSAYLSYRLTNYLHIF